MLWIHRIWTTGGLSAARQLSFRFHKKLEDFSTRQDTVDFSSMIFVLRRQEQKLAKDFIALFYSRLSGSQTENLIRTLRFQDTPSWKQQLVTVLSPGFRIPWINSGSCQTFLGPVQLSDKQNLVFASDIIERFEKHFDVNLVALRGDKKYFQIEI